MVLRASPGITRWNPESRCLPVGDAAIAFDPVSGSGLCFALRSALEAAYVLSQARRGDGEALLAYRKGVYDVFRGHLRSRARAYADEHRFAGAAFWRSKSTYDVSWLA
jgi:2-polyprenyl-6-methoxyphenol hydroxylase-like FAD-dependent oxidoreductase